MVVQVLPSGVLPAAPPGCVVAVCTMLLQLRATAWAAWRACCVRQQAYSQIPCTARQDLCTQLHGRTCALSFSRVGSMGTLCCAWQPRQQAERYIHHFSGLCNEQAGTSSLPAASAPAGPGPAVELPPAAPNPATLPSFEQLCAAERRRLGGRGGEALSPAERVALDRLLKRFRADGPVREASRRLHISNELYPRAMGAFRKFMLRAATPALTAAVTAVQRADSGPTQDIGAAVAAGQEVEGQLEGADMEAEAMGPQAATSNQRAAATGGGSSATLVPEYTPGVAEYLLQIFGSYVRALYKAELDQYAEQVAAMDLRAPHTWYPYARAIRRRIIYHAGPTNSGKTYNALQALRAAQRGVYAGPLRLLAMEVYESLNLGGVHCNLVTGQERLLVPEAGHVACTVEMVDTTSHADVAVVDEIQMIGDEQRGHAWTRALLGLPANELHVCGDMSAVELVAGLAADCGDAFELRTYERFTPLRAADEPLERGLAGVQPGDCLVAFSRAAIYNTRQAVEAQSGHRACIVYGALPAETRRAQARLFNDPASPYKVLIASDAIGMGLNFNIRRVVFTSMVKPVMGPGGSMVKGPVPTSLLLQIAGRAGRRNSVYPEGIATTVAAEDLPRLRAAVAVGHAALRTPAAGLLPEFDTLEMLAAQLLTQFAKGARLDGTYFFCNQDQLLTAAKLLGRVAGLTLEDRYTFCLAPAPLSDERAVTALLQFARMYASGKPVLVDLELLPKQQARVKVSKLSAQDAMAALESWHRVLTLWLWLSQRLGESGLFPGRERVAAAATELCVRMNQGLLASGAPATARSATAEVAPSPMTCEGQLEKSGDVAPCNSPHSRVQATSVPPTGHLARGMSAVQPVPPPSSQSGAAPASHDAWVDPWLRPGGFPPSAQQRQRRPTDDADEGQAAPHRLEVAMPMCWGVQASRRWRSALPPASPAALKAAQLSADPAGELLPAWDPSMAPLLRTTRSPLLRVPQSSHASPEGTV